MFTKQLVLSGFLLLSAIAPLGAMDADKRTEDNSSDVLLNATEYEGSDSVVESAEAEELNMASAYEDASMYRDSIAIESEQQAPMRKKTAPQLEDMSLVQESIAEMPKECSSSEEMAAAHEPIVDISTAEVYQTLVVEDKVADEGQEADLQGVFESMSREEDESFPG